MTGERPLPALRLADKLEQLRPDQMIAIDRRGRVVDRRGRRRRLVRSLAVIGSVCAFMIAQTPVVGIVYTGAIVAWTAYQSSIVRGINRASRLVRAERVDDAERAIAALERGNRRQRAYAAFLTAQILWRRGRLDETVVATARCLQLAPAPGPGFYVAYWGSLFMRASLLLELGRMEEAGPAVASALAAPDGEWYAPAICELEALRAFVTDRPGDLGTDDQLHDRARTALRYNHTGLAVGLLAWAYERRGDAEMCAHLVAEVPARCSHGPGTIERMHPRVWAWLGPQLAALPTTDEELA